MVLLLLLLLVRVLVLDEPFEADGVDVGVELDEYRHIKLLGGALARADRPSRIPETGLIVFLRTCLSKRGEQ